MHGRLFWHMKDIGRKFGRVLTKKLWIVTEKKFVIYKI